jgi:putative membrane protein insertion efficiency factor
MKYLLIFIVKAYQRLISPLLGPRCKYYPTCSSYAVESLKRHGALKGTALAVWRVLRCNPWSLGGIDYVPEKFGFYTLKRRGKNGIFK